MDNDSTNSIIGKGIDYASQKAVKPLMSVGEGENSAKDAQQADTVEVISSKTHQALTSNSFEWFGEVLAIVIGLTIILLAIKQFNFRRLKSFIWRHIDRTLVMMMGIVWTIGFCTYCVGMHVPLANNPFSVVPMAVIHATEMFFGMSDISAIQNDCKNSAEYMFFFGFSHLAAIILSLLFVFRLFGHYLASKIRLGFAALTVCFHNISVLHVFWGYNDRSYLLAKDIIDNPRKGEKVVIVRTMGDQQEEVGNKSFSKHVDAMKMEKDEFDRLCNLDCLMATSFRHLHKLSIDNGNKCRVLHDMLGLRSLSRLVKKSKKVSFFFLGEDETVNTKSMMVLSNDADLLKREASVSFYCHSSLSNPIDVDTSFGMYNEQEYRYCMIDSSQKAVELLKKDVTRHPINFMNVDAAHAAVTTEFNACIIGFGETGTEALSFLYEYSALPRMDGSKMKVHFTMMDENMEELEGRFRMQHPYFKDGNNELTFVTCKVGSSEYRKVISENIDTLNYIVVSLDDDKKGVETALDLFDFAFHNRKDGLKDFAIFIRSYDQNDYDDIKRVIDSYNHNVSESCSTLRLFGSDKEIFTRSVVIDEESLRNAKYYNKEYEGGKGTAEDIWNECFGDVDGLMAKRKCNRLTALKERDTKIRQNISNYMHIGTKLALMGLKSDDTREFERLEAIFATRKKGSLVYSEEQERLTNMSKCEHHRWVASHIMMGFAYGAKDYQAMTHNCIVPWEELDSDMVRSYDNKVFEVSVKIMHNKAIEKQK